MIFEISDNTGLQDFDDGWWKILFQSVGKGSGLYGSITSKDLESAKAAPASAPVSKAPAGAPPQNYKDIPLSSMRAVIAKRLLESKQVSKLQFVSKLLKNFILSLDRVHIFSYSFYRRSLIIISLSIFV